MKAKNLVFKNVEKVVKSDAFKYLFIALALLNVLVYVTTNSMLCLVSFILAYGAADNWVSKNMGINLLVALFVSNVIFSCGKIKENFEATPKENNKKNKNNSLNEIINNSVKSGN